jgi:hypothetical protein
MRDKTPLIVEFVPIAATRLFAAEAALAGVLATSALLMAWIGWEQSGFQGVLAAGVALLACWIPNALSLAVLSCVRNPQHSVSVMLVSMLLRMGFPLALALLLVQSKHWLVDVGVVPMVLVLYLMALFIETVLSLWIMGAICAPAVKAS